MNVAYQYVGWSYQRNQMLSFQLGETVPTKQCGTQSLLILGVLSQEDFRGHCRQIVDKIHMYVEDGFCRHHRHAIQKAIDPGIVRYKQDK